MTFRADSRYFSQEKLWRPPVHEQVAVADDLIALIPEDVHTILDAGCGNGAVTNRLVERWDVLGCDLSASALRHVRAPTLVVDLAAIPLEDRAFDLVLASDVIEHLPDSIYHRALCEIARVARRYVLIAVPHEELLEAAEVACPECHHRYHAHLHQRSYSVDDVQSLLGADFGVRAIQLSGERWTYSDASLLRARQFLTGLDYPFEDAVCPQCGVRRGAVEHRPAAHDVGRRVDAAQAMLSVHGYLPVPNRSEVLVLFERGYVTGQVSLVAEPTAEATGLIEVSRLACVQDPITYPPNPIRIESRHGDLIVALPQCPQEIQVVRGAFEAVEVYDFVRQRYVPAASTGNGVGYFQPIPFGPQGCLLRFEGAAADLVFTPVYGPAPTREEVVALCLGDDPADARRARRLVEVLQLVEEIEAKRERLERELYARDLAFAALQGRADAANALANGLDVQRDSLDRMVSWLQGENAGLLQRLDELHRQLSQRKHEFKELALELKAKAIGIKESIASSKDQCVPQTVLVLSHMYPRDYHPSGGIFVHEQVKALRASGIDARVLSGEPYWINTLNPVRIMKAIRKWWRMGSYKWEYHDGVPLIRFPYIVSSSFLPFQVHAFTYANGVSRCLSRLYRAFDFQLVHAHTSYTDGSAGAKVAVKYGVPLVITEHTGPFRTLTRTSYLRRKTQAAINSASRLISVSSSLLNDIKSQVSMRDSGRACVLPNVVDTDFFRPAPRKSDGRVRVLWVGHFVAIKRVDALVRAFSTALKIQPNLYLKLVGSGELESDIRQLVKSLAIDSYVEFAGRSDRQGLLAHYRECDFLAISSKAETFGVVAIEAMSCGRPVLTTDCGGPAEIINHECLGLVVDKSAEALAQGMLEMALRRADFDPRLIRKVAEQRYSTGAVVTALKSIYSNVLMERKR